MSKYIVTAIFSICSLLAVIIIGLSIGFYFPTFSIVLIPAVIMQTYTGIRAFRVHPAFTSWILVSGFAFLAFSLFRPDADAHGQFSGYGVLMYHLGLSETEHTEPWRFSLELALLLILFQIFVNTYILRHKVVPTGK